MAKPIRTLPVPECPECGSKMVLRRPREGQSWDPFWGCSTYPKCKGSRNILENGLPEDDDDIEARLNAEAERRLKREGYDWYPLDDDWGDR